MENKFITYVCTGCSNELPAGFMNFINHLNECPKNNPSSEIKWEPLDLLYYESDEERKNAIQKQKELDKSQKEKDRKFIIASRKMSEEETYKYLSFSVRGFREGLKLYTSLEVIKEYEDFRQKMIDKYVPNFNK